MYYGIFTLCTQPLATRKAAVQYLRSIGLQTLNYTSREAAELALASVPEPHRSVLSVSDHGWA